MALCYSSLLLTLLLISVTTAQASDEKEEIIEIDSDEEPEIQPRVARQAPEGSGMWPDYNLDDEDTIVPEYGSTNIVSSRVIPEASSPTFSYPASPRTSRGQTPSLNTATPRRGNRHEGIFLKLTKKNRRYEQKISEKNETFGNLG